MKILKLIAIVCMLLTLPNVVAGQIQRTEAIGTTNAQTGTTYTVVFADRGKLVTFNNGSPVAVELPQATASNSFRNGWTTFFYNLGAGTVTITPTTSTINGNATLVLETDQGALVFSDGTNYSAIVTAATVASGTITDTIEFTAAGSNAGTAAPFLNIPSTNGPAANAIEGTNIINAVLDFDAATDESIQGSFILHPNWTGNIDLDVEAFANEAGTNVARLGLQTICVGSGETYDPAWNTAQTFNWTNTGTNQRVIATQATITVTGCAANERLFFKFFRDADGTSGTDSLGVDLRVVSLRFTVQHN